MTNYYKRKLFDGENSGDLLQLPAKMLSFLKFVEFIELLFYIGYIY